MAAATTPLESKLRVFAQNIACSSRDEHGKNVYQSGDEPVKCSPLYSRLPFVIENIKGQNPDVAVLFEAGRESMGHSWTEMAVEIEKGTQLTYVGLVHANTSATPFAHAIFVNRRTAHVSRITNLPTYKSESGSGDFDAHVSLVTVKQLLGENYITIGGVHMPVGAKAREHATNWLADHHDLATFWAGDFNTYWDGNGPWMIERLEKTGMHHAPCNLEYTFRGFDYDAITVLKEDLDRLHPLSEVYEETETHVTVRPVSTLDHVFINKSIVFKCEATFLPLTPASDHCGIVVTVTF